MQTVEGARHRPGTRNGSDATAHAAPGSPQRDRLEATQSTQGDDGSAGRPRTQPGFGALLAQWRRRRGISQLALALRATVSARHISFLETGRSRPSEAMIGRLSAVLELSPATENELRASIGLIPKHSDRASSRLHPQVAGGAGLAGHVFETVARFHDALTAGELIDSCRPLLRDLGVAHFFSGTIRLAANGSSWVDLDSVGAFPQPWLERYGAMEYRVDDPLLREAHRAHRPFFWSDVASGDRPLPTRARRIIEEAKDFGITGGFVTPVRRSDGTVRAVSMMGTHIDDRDPHVRLSLQVVGTCLLDRLETIDAVPAVRDLPVAALECLRWTLAGRAPDQIGAQLKLAERAVRDHLRTACRTLGVRNRHQAAARAVALRLISSS